MIHRRKDIAHRYGVDLRTVDRWQSAGMLPPPHCDPCGRRFWREDDLAKVESLKGREWTKQNARRAGWLHRKLSLSVASRKTPLQLLLSFKF